MKVHPEEVEAVINAHPWVRTSLASRRAAIPSPGRVVTADVVLAEESSRAPAAPGGGPTRA